MKAAIAHLRGDHNDAKQLIGRIRLQDPVERSLEILTRVDASLESIKKQEKYSEGRPPELLRLVDYLYQKERIIETKIVYVNSFSSSFDASDYYQKCQENLGKKAESQIIEARRDPETGKLSIPIYDTRDKRVHFLLKDKLVIVNQSIRAMTIQEREDSK